MNVAPIKAVPIQTLLIANRGEIAARIIRSCRRLGIESVAVYSDADESNLYTSLADRSFPLGGESAAESYLQGEKLIATALRAGADAIHPGYGFLAENPTFAEAVVRNGIRFVGPSADTMRLLGHKHSARLLAKQHGLPISPGYDGDDQSLDALCAHALTVGFPLLVKAAAGGGGKGMRRVEREEELSAALLAARREAESFFADGRLILERVFAPARHIEVQLLADMHGNIVHLFERDCSLQRSYQKLIEEAPARALPKQLREQLYDAAITIGKAVKLHGAATVEFLVSTDPAASLPFIFLEVNPRLQVEHPVTEMVTGIDIVEQQLKIASGAALELEQSAISLCGHAIEARVCAENPAKGFLPTGGRISALVLPTTSRSLRVEHSLTPSYLVTSNYDSLLAKIIASGNSFEDATNGLITAIDSLQISGVDTNTAFLIELLSSDLFRSAPPSTSGLTHVDTTLTSREQIALLAYVAFLEPVIKRPTVSTFASLGWWRAGSPRMSGVPPRTLSLHSETATLEFSATASLLESKSRLHQRIAVDGVTVTLQAYYSEGTVTERAVQLTIDDQPLRAALHSSAVAGELYYAGHRIRHVEHFPKHGAAEQGREALQQVRSPLPGKILALPIAVGDRVACGQLVAILESMKMEHSIAAPTSGVVTELCVREGESVQSGDLVAIVDSSG